MVVVRWALGTPSPVEALPCGSMSTISTLSPTAASAVPRLIAVVVLPTPPFWLATTRTRGRLTECDTGELPDFQDGAGRIGLALVPDHAHLPRFMGFDQFRIYRLAFQEQICCTRPLESHCIAEQLRKRRTSPRRDHIERFCTCVFDPHMPHIHRDIYRLGRGFE